MFSFSVFLVTLQVSRTSYTASVCQSFHCYSARTRVTLILFFAVQFCHLHLVSLHLLISPYRSLNTPPDPFYSYSIKIIKHWAQLVRWRQSERRDSNPDLPPRTPNAFTLTDHNHTETLFEASKVAELPFATSGKVVFFYSILTKKITTESFSSKTK